RSGVIVVLGERGAGKTHMVHALRWLQHHSPRVVVTPTIYEAYRPFIEFLLHQLIRHFQNESQSGPGTLELLAEAFTRQVLAQALSAMTETDWLILTTPKHTLARLWGFGTKRTVDTMRSLIGDIERRKASSLQEICDEYDFEYGLLHHIALV